MMTSNTLAKGVRPHTTHSACPERMAEYGGKTVGCCCTGHVCKIKVLFLDIDGVVNSRATTDFRQLYPLDKYMAFMVGKIQLDTGCKVVLSSSWRNHPDGVAVVNKSIVQTIDITPNMSGMRGNEIAEWLRLHPEVERYAILDDDSDMLPEQMPNFFKTTFDTGLTEDIAKAVTDHLNGVAA